MDLPKMQRMKGKRLLFIALLFLFAGIGVFLRLFYLQLICYPALASKADRQEFLTVDLGEMARGIIYDRNGKPITANEETAELLIVPSLIENVQMAVSSLHVIGGFSEELLKSRIVGINHEGKEIRKEPFIAKTDLTDGEITDYQSLEESGIYVIPRQGRYFRDFPGQHLLGSLENSETGTGIGSSGLERVYDKILSAVGKKQLSILVDERNRAISPGEIFLSGEDSSAAGSLTLTLDLGIQRAAEASLGDLSGAVVVLDSKSGDVLALASSPKYDPYHVAENITDSVYVNKAFSAYPPASLFKIFTSAVALDKGIVTPEMLFFCDGGYRLDSGNTVSCWKKDGHGFLNFEDALAASCNPVFVKTAQLLGKNQLEKAFDFWELDDDRLLGYPLAEASSLKIQSNGDADLANIGLGESGVMLTPLNVAKMLNVIAADGILYTPRVVLSATEADGSEFPVDGSDLPLRVISSSTAKKVTEMMVKTFQSGTAAKLNLESFHIAGKTGTSETGNVWIGGFFPYEEPVYTVVILITDGSSGAADGGPVLKKLCAYLANDGVNY